MPAQTAKTYAAVGVDVDENDRLTERYRALARGARRPEQVGGVGSFSGLFDISALKGYSHPVLAATTDGVGTKVILATLLGQYRSVGEDLVNHCVNDLLAVGAEPLFFLDYFASSRLTEEQKLEIVEGVAGACRNSNVALLGGETADMPDLYGNTDFDLAGTMVGVVEKGQEITGERIQPGDVVMGLPSNGLHTNGYSLVREVFDLRPRPSLGQDEDKIRRADILQQPFGLPSGTLGEALLEPHLAYWQDLKDWRGVISGIAHITGGGVQGNIGRVLPDSMTAVLRPELWQAKWAIPPIFGLIQEQGQVSLQEMYRVFNMGIGMAFMTSPENAGTLLEEIPEVVTLGEVIPAEEGWAGECVITGIDG